MADRNLNNFDTTLAAALGSGDAVLVLTNADANWLHDVVFSQTDTARLTIVEGTTIETVVVSARTVDQPIAGQAEITIDTRAAEQVGAAAAVAQAFSAGARVYADLTAAQVQAIRDAGGGGGGGPTYTNLNTTGAQGITAAGFDYVTHTAAGATTLTITIPDTAGAGGAWRVVVVAATANPGDDLTVAWTDAEAGYSFSGDSANYTLPNNFVERMAIYEVLKSPDFSTTYVRRVYDADF